MKRGKARAAWPVLILSVLFTFSLLSDAEGAWHESGRPVCDSPGDQWYPGIISDGAGGAIIAWQDYRQGAGNIYIQRIDPGGDPLWTMNGTGACSDVSNREFFRQIVEDGEGGAILAWTDHRGETVDIYVQRIAGDGSPLWGDGALAVSSAEADDYFPVIASDETGGAFVAWSSGPGSAGTICLQRIDSSGEAVFASGGITVSLEGGQAFPAIVEDGTGGAIVVWISGGPENSSILSQRIDASGNLLWTPSGLAVCTDRKISSFPDLAGDGSGGAIIVWQDRIGGDNDIFAQRLQSSGAVAWGVSGVEVSSADGEQWHPQLVFSAGRPVVVWIDESAGECDIRAQKLDMAGVLQWAADGMVVCAEPSMQLNPEIVEAIDNSVIVTWQDGRSGRFGIYAQKIDDSGTGAWAAGGVPVAVSDGDQRLPGTIGEGAGGMFVVWEDNDGESDILCQRVDDSGAYLATTLASFSSICGSDGIVLKWSMSETETGMEFVISRKTEPEGVFFTTDAQPNSLGNSTWSCRDESAEPGIDYYYMVEANGSEGLTFLFETGALRYEAAKSLVKQNYPNPFNPQTTIEYSLAAATSVILDIFDVSGRRIVRLEDGMREGGTHMATWNGLDGRGNPVSSGVYIYRLTAGKEKFTRKMILLR